MKKARTTKLPNSRFIYLWWNWK